MIWRYILCLMFLLALFANASDGKDFDIVERSINFLMFFGILYYLIASKIKVAYQERISSIADSLEAVQATLKASEQKKEKAREQIEKAKKDAKALLATSETESRMMAEKLKELARGDMVNLEKSHKDRMSIEKRHMQRDVISEILDEMFDKGTLVMDRKEFVNIILKKVA